MEKELKKQMDDQLKDCNTMNEVLDVANAYYDFDQPLGLVAKGTVKVGLKKVIKACRIDEREDPIIMEEE